MELFENIAVCVTRGKVNQVSAYPPDLRGQDGVFELVRDALANGVAPSDILTKGLMVGMNEIGQKFSRNEAFVPDLLMAAKAMTAGMDQLKPAFESGEAQHRGVFVVGTVKGDLHDIGKNLVRMMMEGAGTRRSTWGGRRAGEVCGGGPGKPGCIVGLSALLTTTMINMETITPSREGGCPATVVAVGARRFTQEFCDRSAPTPTPPTRRG
jgi:methanogenic corrinoid protein MtbC1